MGFGSGDGVKLISIATSSGSGFAGRTGVHIGSPSFRRSFKMASCSATISGAGSSMSITDSSSESFGDSGQFSDWVVGSLLVGQCKGHAWLQSGSWVSVLDFFTRKLLPCDLRRRRIGRANAGTRPTALLVWRLWAPARVLLPCPCRGLPLPCRWAWVGPRLDGLRERGVPPHWWGCVPGLHQVWPPSQWGGGYICRVATFAGWLHLPGATG